MRGIQEQFSDAVVMAVNDNGCIESVAGQVKRFLGYDAAELKSYALEDLITPAEKTRKILRSCLAHGAKPDAANYSYEAVAQGAQGKKVPVRVSFKKETTQQGSQLLCLLRDPDISRSDNFWLNIDAMPGSFYVFDEEHRLLLWNRYLEDVLGYDPKELFLKRNVDFIHPDDRAWVDKEVEKLLQTGIPRSVEYRILRKDGTSIFHIGNGLVIQIGKRTFFAGLSIDISELWETREELQKRLAEIEALKQCLEAENFYLRSEIEPTLNHWDIIGESQPIKNVLAQIEQVAPTNTTVLITGETGTGKELIARRIHELSLRGDKTMIKINCAAMAPTLIEAELFGRGKGAYTGAVTAQAGRFEIADGSTLFLDEISELPLELQAKLLRVLESGEFERVGESKTRRVDVRILAATNRDLEQAVRNYEFRKDLFYRINVFPIHVPSLRTRREDIPLLVRHFVYLTGQKMGKHVETVSKRNMKRLVNYSWPGNIRELRNLIERSLIFSKGSDLNINFPPQREEDKENIWSLEEVQRRHISKALTQTRGKISGPGGAAELLGLRPTTLRSRMKKLGIPKSETP